MEKASKQGGPYFAPELFGRACEGPHMETVLLSYVVPWGPKGHGVCPPPFLSGVSGGSVCTCMTQYGGRGATAPNETLIFVSSGRSSNWRTALLAVVSASSLPRTFVWAPTFFSVVRSPLCSLSPCVH